MGAKLFDYAQLAFDLLDEFDRQLSADQVASALSAALGNFGFTSFLIVDAPEVPTQPMFILNGWPVAWAEHYMREDYYKDDPVAAKCRRSFDPFEWSECRYDPDEQPRAKEIMGAACEFGLKSGFLVPVSRVTGTMSGVTMAGAQPDFDVRAKRAMHLIGLYAHAKAVSLLGRKDDAEAVELTEGEREVLRWTAVGKSSWEISVILNLSEAGVVWRLKRAMSKLRASNKTQAVVSAILARQISI